MSQDAESKKQQEMMSMLAGGSDAFSQLSHIPGAVEQVLALAAAADPVFFNQPPGSPFAVGTHPDRVAVGDFNGDGKLDLVITNNQDNTVSVLLNTTLPGSATASFAAHQDFSVGTQPNGVAVGDFNGDGKLDLAVANINSNTVSVLLNTTLPGSATASFAAHQDFTVGANPQVVAVGDFNGDGKLDLVAANSGGNTASVLLNTTAPGSATASFAAHQDFTVGTTPFGVAVGDFNGDGKLDLVATNHTSNNVSVLLNTSSGGALSFAPQQTFSVGSGPDGVAVGDFNRDGKLDLAVANSNDGNVSVLLQSPLVVNVETIQAFQNVLFSGPIAIITGANMLSDTHVTINWGDGSPLDTTGTLSQNLDGSLTVSGSHSYTSLGTFPLTVTATEGIFTSQGVGQAIVSLPPLTVLVGTIQAVATVPFSGAVAIISGATSVNDTTASINWGDNTTTPGKLVANPDGTLTVSGSHTYNAAGTFPLQVTATEGSRNAQGTGQAIVQAPLAVQVSTIQASANVSFSGPVATISGANSASDTTATINWGDGTPATPGVVSGSGTLTVSGSHTYSQGGTFTVTVTATEGTRSAQGTGVAMVQPALAVEVDTIQAVATVPFSGAVAIISGANSASDTTAMINWGDTTVTPGTIVDNLNGTLTVSGTHTYATAGTFTLAVSATEGANHAQGSVQVTVQVPLVVQVNTIQPTGLVNFSGAVATISGANSASDTTAMINWGDGTATPGTVSGSGTLTVSGSHTYSQGGTFTLTVTATEGTRSAQGNGVAMVHPPLAVQVDTIQAVATVPFSGAVAIISGATSASDTTAMINWGDSTPATLGTVVANPNGTLTVSGTHTYNQGGIFPLTVIASEGTRTAQVVGQALVKTANLHARAFGVQSLNPTQGPFGDVSIPPTGGNQTATVPVVLLPDLMVSGITDTVSGSLTPTPPHADASSTIGALVGFSIVASGISATAHADLCTPGGVLSGATTFASLIIGGTIFPAHFAPGASTVVPLPGLGTVTLNEQTVTQNANQSLLVVNALHIQITQGAQAGTDIVVGHVEAGITLS